MDCRRLCVKLLMDKHTGRKKHLNSIGTPYFLAKEVEILELETGVRNTGIRTRDLVS